MKSLPPVEDDVYAALEQFAEPFEDISAVLRRLLSHAGRAAPAPPVEVGRKMQKKRRVALSDADYELPLLRALVELGGRAATSEVIDKVGGVLGDRLGPIDWDELPSSGYVRWKNRVQFARLNLLKRGDMDDSTPRGIWAITDQGRERVAQAGRP